MKSNCQSLLRWLIRFSGYILWWLRVVARHMQCSESHKIMPLFRHHRRPFPNGTAFGPDHAPCHWLVTCSHISQDWVTQNVGYTCLEAADSLTSFNVQLIRLWPDLRPHQSLTTLCAASRVVIGTRVLHVIPVCNISSTLNAVESLVLLRQDKNRLTKCFQRSRPTAFTSICNSLAARRYVNWCIHNKDLRFAISNNIFESPYECFFNVR